MITKKFDTEFSFNEFKAVPQAHLLIKRSQQKRIEPKVMSLLVLLASRSGEVVTRGEILSTLWPNIVVGDEVISQLIYSLRNALADDAKKPKYIETIPKKGYRFISEVNVTSGDKSTSIASKESTNIWNIQRHVSLRVKWLISVCLLLTAGLFSVWLVNNDNLTTNTNNFKINNFKIKNILPVTQEIGVEGDFSFHENHDKMLYISTQVNRVDLYLKRLGKNQSVQITNDEWIEYSPIWLNQEAISYIREKSGHFQIIHHVLQTEPEIIYESDNAIFNLTLREAAPFSISFIEYDDYQHNKLHEIKSIDLMSKAVTYLHESTLNLPSDIRYPVYSADGQTLYFFNNTNEVKEIVSLHLKSNKYHTITNKFSWVEHIALLDSGNLLISGEVSATKGIWQLNIYNKTIKNILPSSGGQRITRAKFKQNQIFYTTYEASTNQFIADINKQTLDYLPELNSNANEYYGVYSKDNKVIYFVSNRTGFYEVWSYNQQTLETKQITRLQANFIYKPALSNTKNLFAVVYQKEKLTLAIISLLTGKTIKERVIPNMKYPLSWSKDDSSIYISEHIKHVNIYQYDSKTLESKLIQANAGLYANENPDNTKLTLIDYRVGGLINKDQSTGKTTPLIHQITSLDALVPGELTVIKQSVFSVIKHGPARKLQEYSLQNDQHSVSSKLLMDLPDWSRVTDFNIDGTKAIFFKANSPKGDIMKMQFIQ